jgi:predicted RNA-binding protein with EMAP domain
MYRKSLVIKKHKENIKKLTAEAQEILASLPKEKDWKQYRINLDKYTSLLAKVYTIRRKIENLNNGLPELGRDISSFGEDNFQDDY